MMIVKNELLEWVKLDPDNKKVRYNLAVIELELWNNNLSNKDEKSIQSQLLNLKKYSIRQDLIDRTLVNFHIIRAQNKMRDQEYDAKDESVEFILETYENFSLSNYDYLSLALFLTYYSELYDAIDLLEDKVQALVIDEDLLFYYLNLTLINSKITRTENYRKIMLNAINLHKKRFCTLFNAASDGGVTFQLLEDQYLRKTYCENCQK